MYNILTFSDWGLLGTAHILQNRHKAQSTTYKVQAHPVILCLTCKDGQQGRQLADAGQEQQLLLLGAGAAGVATLSLAPGLAEDPPACWFSRKPNITSLATD